jgi:ABC-type glycerol-3-phosphate transport system substrate-binding protein
MWSSRKAHSVAVLVVVFLLTLFAGALAEQRKVVWYVRSNSAENAWQREAILSFNSIHPDIDIELLVATWDEYDPKLTILFSVGQSPDIFSNFGWNGFMDMTLRGMTLDLAPLIKKDQVDLSAFPPYALDYYTYNGGMYGIPFMMAPSAIWYNKELVERAGVIPPTVDASDRSWNWGAMVEVLKKLTIDRNGDGTPDQYGVNLPWGGDLWGGFPALVQLFGGDLFPVEAYATGNQPGAGSSLRHPGQRNTGLAARRAVSSGPYRAALPDSSV